MLASSRDYKLGDRPRHCSPCFLVAKAGSTAMRLVVDYVEVHKKTQNHSGSIPNMENTLERIAKGPFKNKMDRCSGFWQVDVTRAAQEPLAFVTPKGRVFRCKVMPFGVLNTPAHFQELMRKFLYILRGRPLVQELVSHEAETEAHSDDVSLVLIPRRIISSSYKSFSLSVGNSISASNWKVVSSCVRRWSI